MRRACLLLGLALLVGACGQPVIEDLTVDDGSVEANPWVLEGVSPDGRHLLVSTLFGGVASDCNRFEGWIVDESREAIEISALLWRRRTPSSCTGEGVVESRQVDLDEPLGGRPLVGCGDDDCFETGSRGGELFVGQVVATEDAVAVAGASSLDAYSADGELVAQVVGFSSGEVLAVPGDVVVRNGGAEAVAIDLRTGEELWRTTGWANAATDETVYVCRGQDSDGLAAVDASTGQDLWSTDLVCESLVAHGERLTIVGYDPAVDGGHRLVIVDAAIGEPLSNEQFFDGYDDQVNGFDRAIAVGSNTIATGPQANLVVLADDGTELARQQRGLGLPLGQADGIAIIGGYDQVLGYELATMSELWTLDVDAFSTISVADESIWSLDRTAGAVSRLDPRTGTPLWTTEVGLTSGFDVAADEDTAYIITTQALVAVDNDSGEITWTKHRPHQTRD